MNDDLPEYARKTRDDWNAVSDEYQAHVTGVLPPEKALAWGEWRIPESELNVLGDVAGKDMLEFGCGGAQWSIALTRLGALSFPMSRLECDESKKSP